eukprot:scaffold64687_cov74-Phaeocystis_antarctica.AAC.3
MSSPRRWGGTSGSSATALPSTRGVAPCSSTRVCNPRREAYSEATGCVASSASTWSGPTSSLRWASELSSLSTDHSRSMIAKSAARSSAGASGCRVRPHPAASWALLGSDDSAGSSRLPPSKRLRTAPRLSARGLPRATGGAAASAKSRCTPSTGKGSSSRSAVVIGSSAACRIAVVAPRVSHACLVSRSAVCSAAMPCERPGSAPSALRISTAVGRASVAIGPSPNQASSLVPSSVSGLSPRPSSGVATLSGQRAALAIAGRGPTLPPLLRLQLSSDDAKTAPMIASVDSSGGRCDTNSRATSTSIGATSAVEATSCGGLKPRRDFRKAARSSIGCPLAPSSSLRVCDTLLSSAPGWRAKGAASQKEGCSRKPRVAAKRRARRRRSGSSRIIFAHHRACSLSASSFLSPGPSSGLATATLSGQRAALAIAGRGPTLPPPSPGAAPNSSAASCASWGVLMASVHTARSEAEGVGARITRLRTSSMPPL